MNHGGLVGTLTGIQAAIDHLNKRGFDVHESTYHKLVKTICGAHEDLQELEALIIEGPHVPFEQRIIPMASSRSVRRPRKKR